MMMALYLNFFMITTLPIISAFSKPDPNRPLTPRSVQDNFFGLENHLLTWGNILILASGLLGGFFYTTGRSDYITNSDPFYIFGVGYHPDCQLVTSMFLLMGIPLATTSVLVYKSHPWKNTIYKNIVLTIVIIVNIIIMIVFYAANNQIAGLFGTVYLPLIVCLFLFLISTGSQILAFIYNMIIIKRMHPEYDFIFIETNEATKETDATKLNMTLMSEPV